MLLVDSPGLHLLLLFILVGKDSLDLIVDHFGSIVLLHESFSTLAFVGVEQFQLLLIGHLALLKGAGIFLLVGLGSGDFVGLAFFFRNTRRRHNASELFGSRHAAQLDARDGIAPVID